MKTLEYLFVFIFLVTYCDPDFEGQPQILHDPDNSPVYEQPHAILLPAIIKRNDLVALLLYNESPHTRIFILRYEISGDDPFSTVFGSRSFDALGALIGMYQSDPSLTEPLDEYAQRIPISFIHETCAMRIKNERVL